jgi:hypothetical protein
LPLVLVQDEGSGDDGATDTPSDGTAATDQNQPDDALGITGDETASIAADLSQGTRFCGNGVDLAYKADCLSDQYKAAAKAMPAKGGYSDARKALLDAAAKLHALAVANADASRPAARFSGGKARSHRALTPVANPAAVNAQADAVVKATEVVLLRSAEGSKERRAAYTAIAGGV